MKKKIITCAALSGAFWGGAAAPLEYLTSAGSKSDAVLGLTWAVTGVSVGVILVIGLVLCAAIRRNPALVLAVGEKGPVLPEGRAMTWVWIGVALSTALLLASVVWTMLVLARLHPATQPRLTIEITGRQWWWQVRYLADDPAQSFLTANEIHIPAGEPVRLKLVAGDVIHSFWVPQLTGKTDLIPGQTNESWIEARQPGVYRGQCGEYCGVQHAHMGFLVIADTPSDFARWRSHQLEAPAANVTGSADAALFTARCGGCHAVRGTDAAGALGPDLSHLMTRRTLAAALLPNDAPSLGHWIADPQNLKPGNFMSVPRLTAQDLGDIHAYLNQLR